MPIISEVSFHSYHFINMLYQFSSICKLLRALYDEWMLTFVIPFLHLLSGSVIFFIYSVNMENYTNIFLDVKPNFHS